MDIAMNKQPSVSVIMAFLNAEKFISEAIESVLAQTFSDWELILVDDGSTDGSSEIAKRFANEYPDKVFYLDHPDHQNCGASASRNFGVQRAKGKYIALLDSDDVWLSNKLNDQVRIIESSPDIGMVCGAVEQWYSWDNAKGLFRRKDKISPVGASQNTAIYPPQAFNYFYPFHKGMPPTPSDLLLRKEVLERVDGFENAFRDQYQLYEDQCFLCKVYLYFPFHVSDKNWTKYRRHSSQCISTVNKAGQYYQVKEFFLKWFESYLIKHGFQGTEVWNLLQKSLRHCRHPWFITLRQDIERFINFWRYL